jgi:hypothetical protein
MIPWNRKVSSASYVRNSLFIWSVYFLLVKYLLRAVYEKFKIDEDLCYKYFMDII